MIIKDAKLAAINKGFSQIYQSTFDGTESQFEKIATVVPSKSAVNTYGWLGEMPNMREWVGARVVKDFKEHSYEITNKLWESTIGCKLTDIEDDNLGMYKPMVEELARNAKKHPDQLTFALLKAGISSLCYDGQNFFDTDHPVYPNHDGTGTAATVANFVTGTAPAWYLLDTTRALKPIIFQERTKPNFQAMTKADDESVFTDDVLRYGVRARHNVGFGFWQLARCEKTPLTEDNFNNAIATMQDLKADGGNKLGVNPNLLVVPPALRATALKLVKAQQLASGASNVNYNVVDVMVSPWVGD